MRVVHTETRVYPIQELRELSESAFSAAHQKWQQHAGQDFADWVIDDFSSVARHLGFDVSARDVHCSGFWSQGDGASFTGQYCLSGYGAGPVSEYAPQDDELRRIAERIKLSRAVFYRRLIKAIPCEFMRDIRGMFTNRTACAYVVIDRSSSRYSHELTMRADNGDNVRDDIYYRLGDDIEYCDETEIDFACEEFAENILSDAQQLAQWLYRALEKEYEFQISEEQFLDSCEANGYEFDESGEMQ